MNLKVRPALLTDQRQIANLIHFGSHVHRHLDWRNPVDWLDSPPFFAIEIQGQIVAALGCPPDPPTIAWMRLFVNSENIPVQESWNLLWEKVRSELFHDGKYVTAAIVINDWLQELLISSGFSIQQSIVMLERDGGDPEKRGLPQVIKLRAMMPYDLPAVAEVDAAAFELLWQNALPTLERAYPQAFKATIAELDGQVIGYQLSTRNSLGIHLARLAVRPDKQGKGLGYALVEDLIQQANERGITHMTVNTQSDNTQSIDLYNRLGFRESGDRYPVFCLHI